MGRVQQILVTAASSAALALGCCNSGTSPNEPAYATGLRQAVEEPGLYSISFGVQGQPFLLTWFPVQASPFTCEAGLASPSAILELWTPLGSGTFAVGPSNSDSFPPTSGQAKVVYQGGTSESTIDIHPIEGQVVITSAPTDATEELGGTHLVGSFHLGFPANPIFPDCGGEFIPDAGFVVSWCLCDDATTGKTVSVCDGGDLSECCQSPEPASFFLDGTLDTPPCGALCVDPPGSGLCEPLWPDAGAE